MLSEIDFCFLIKKKNEQNETLVQNCANIFTMTMKYESKVSWIEKREREKKQVFKWWCDIEWTSNEIAQLFRLPRMVFKKNKNKTLSILRNWWTNDNRQKHKHTHIQKQVDGQSVECKCPCSHFVSPILKDLNDWTRAFSCIDSLWWIVHKWNSENVANKKYWNCVHKI